jgi:hypothetical protein
MKPSRVVARSYFQRAEKPEPPAALAPSRYFRRHGGDRWVVWLVIHFHAPIDFQS